MEDITATALELCLTRDANNIIKARDGVEAYGLYFELVRFFDTSGTFDVHIKYFLFENSIATYARQRGKKAGRWQMMYCTDHADARAKLIASVQRCINGVGRCTEMRGEPLLIQASISDIVAVRKNDKRGPDCRWRGISTIDGRYGKVTDELQKSTGRTVVV